VRQGSIGASSGVMFAIPRGQSDFNEYIKAEEEKWGKVIKDRNLQLN
jgi:hypothetical protein